MPRRGSIRQPLWGHLCLGLLLAVFAGVLLAAPAAASPTPPDLLSGTLTDVGKYSSWTEGEWQYSGFKRTLTFSNVRFRQPGTFKPGAMGDTGASDAPALVIYQLCGNRANSDCLDKAAGPSVSFTPYTQTATNGTCTWTWKVVADPKGTESGTLDLASSNGGWSVSSLELSMTPLITDASVSGPSNCQFDKPTAIPPFDQNSNTNQDWADGPSAPLTAPYARASSDGENVTFSGTNSVLEGWQGPQTHTFSGQLSGSCSITGAAMDGPAPSTDLFAGAAAAGSGQQCCPKLTVDAKPSPQAAYGFSPRPLSFEAIPKGGCPPRNKFKYRWKRTKAPGAASLTAKGIGPNLRVTLRCPSRQDACFGEVSYRVTVTDTKDNQASKDVFIKWCRDRKGTLPASGQPCTNQFTEKEWKELYKELDDGLKENQNWIGPTATHFAEEGGTSILLPAAEAVAPVAGAAAAGAEVALWGRARQRWGRLYELWNADPPGAAIARVAVPGAVSAAKLPACAPVSGRFGSQAAQDCAQDRPLYAAAIDATDRTNAVLGALVSTNNRYGTALRQEDASAMSLQQAAVSILTVQLGDALRAERTAAISLATRLQSQGLAGPMTRARMLLIIGGIRQLRSFPAVVQKELGRNVTPAKFAGELKSDLARTPGTRFDLLASVSKPVPQALSTAPSPVTAAQGGAVVGALRAQGLLSAGAASQLKQALAALAVATDAASVRAARTAFANAAAGVGGPAGTFLLVAARALSAG